MVVEKVKDRVEKREEEENKEPKEDMSGQMKIKKSKIGVANRGGIVGGVGSTIKVLGGGVISGL